MNSPEDPQARIVKLMREATTSGSSERDGNTVKVRGNGNTVAGGDVYNFNPTIRPKVTVKTGDGVIDAKQKAEISTKLKQWLTARNAVRREKMTIAAAWSAFNAAMKVNSYAELRPEQFPGALDWLKKQRAILSSMKSAPTKIVGFRNDMITAIKARSKQLGDLNYYRPHIVKSYGVESLTGLSDRQLQELRAWIMQQRR